MKYDPNLLSEGERIVTQFRPHYRMLLVPMGWFVLVVLALAALAWIGDTWWYVNDILLLVVLIAFVLLVVWPVIKWWFTLYVLTTERLISRQGVISRSGVEIPLENINNVLFSQSVIERILKSGDLMIESAGQSGQVRFDNVWRPDEFQALLYRTREERTRALSEQTHGGASGDPTEQLERLARLHRQGSITDEEYERSKRALLEGL
jgi:uncharacterized membrane protein YdbT with pleckstrin-like domain